MEQIKRNSQEFKIIKGIFVDFAGVKSGKKWIKLFSIKPYQNLDDRVLLNNLKKDAGVLYELNYESTLEYLRNRSKKLFRQDKKALYFFKASKNSNWIEFPFELTGKLKKEIFHLKVVK